MSTLNTNASSRPSELPNLDLLRAIAVLLVLADHVLETIGQKNGISFHPYDWYLGRLGVLIFFVHTSLVLMWSMHRLQFQGWPLIRSFYIRRAFRIYPLSILSVLLVVSFEIPALPWNTYTPPSTGALASNLLLTMNLTDTKQVLAPLWSLPLEMQMYLALPLIFLLIKARDSMRVYLILYILAFFAAWLLPLLSFRFSVALYAPCFMAGVLAYGLQKQTEGKYSGYLWPLFLFTLIALYILVEDLTPGIHHNLLEWFVCLGLGIMIPSFQQLSVQSINRITHYLAKYSYGIYLFHCIALWFGCYKLDVSAPLQWTVAIVTLVALSVLSFHVLEQPAIRFGARLAGRQGMPNRSLVPR